MAMSKFEKIKFKKSLCGDGLDPDDFDYIAQADGIQFTIYRGLNGGRWGFALTAYKGEESLNGWGLRWSKFSYCKELAEKIRAKYKEV